MKWSAPASREPQSFELNIRLESHGLSSSIALAAIFNANSRFEFKGGASGPRKLFQIMRLACAYNIIQFTLH
jgi:hypothetical protein